MRYWLIFAGAAGGMIGIAGLLVLFAWWWLGCEGWSIC